jgi:3-oxoacyl-(acyl-carrier-protein) synthase
VTPAGVGVDRLWGAIRSGRSAIDSETVLDLEGLPLVPVSARIPCSALATIREAWNVPEDEALLRAVIDQALDESGLVESAASARPGRVAVLTSLQGEMGMDETGTRTPQPWGIGSSFYGDLCERLGTAPSLLPVQATCVTGMRLVGEAARLIETDRADCAVVAVASRAITPLYLAAFSRSLSLTRWGGPPSTACRPFDRRRTGTVLGEAAAAVVIESEAAVARRASSPLGRIAGWAAASAIENPIRPSHGSMAKVMRRAIANAGLTPAAVELVDTAGTGSILGDRMEGRAIHQALGDRVPELGITAHKSMLGYTSRASSLVELLADIAAMHASVVPPVPTCEEQHPEDEELPIRTTEQPREFDTVLKNGYGMGGQYTALVLKKS